MELPQPSQIIKKSLLKGSKNNAKCKHFEYRRTWGSNSSAKSYMTAGVTSLGLLFLIFKMEIVF